MAYVVDSKIFDRAKRVMSNTLQPSVRIHAARNQRGLASAPHDANREAGTHKPDRRRVSFLRPSPACSVTASLLRRVTVPCSLFHVPFLLRRASCIDVSTFFPLRRSVAPRPARGPLRRLGCRLRRQSLVALLLLFPLGACEQQNKKIADLEDRAAALERKNADQAKDLIAREETIRGLQRRVKTLEAIGGPGRVQLLCPTARIEIDPKSRGYDQDGQPGDDGIVVYLRPYDADGDIIKAAGIIHVQVLDLAAPPTQQLITEKRWSPEETRKVWFGRLMTNHYTLRLPWGEKGPPRHSSVTVRVVFHDVITGETFEAQKLVTVALPPTPAGA